MFRYNYILLLINMMAMNAILYTIGFFSGVYIYFHNNHTFFILFTASAALALSDIPWDGPVGKVKTCLI